MKHLTIAKPPAKPVADLPEISLESEFHAIDLATDHIHSLLGLKSRQGSLQGTRSTTAFAMEAEELIPGFCANTVYGAKEQVALESISETIKTAAAKVGEKLKELWEKLVAYISNLMGRWNESKNREADKDFEAALSAFKAHKAKLREDALSHQYITLAYEVFVKNSAEVTKALRELAKVTEIAMGRNYELSAIKDRIQQIVGDAGVRTWVSEGGGTGLSEEMKDKIFKTMFPGNNPTLVQVIATADEVIRPVVKGIMGHELDRLSGKPAKALTEAELGKLGEAIKFYRDKFVSIDSEGSNSSKLQKLMAELDKSKIFAGANFFRLISNRPEFELRVKEYTYKCFMEEYNAFTALLRMHLNFRSMFTQCETVWTRCIEQ